MPFVRWRARAPEFVKPDPSVSDCVEELLVGGVQIVEHEQDGGRCRTDLRQRLGRDARADAAHVANLAALRSYDARQLRREPGLPDPPRPGDDDDMPVTFHRLTPRLVEPEQVTLPADQRRAEVELRRKLSFAKRSASLSDQLAARCVALGGRLGESFGENRLERAMTRQRGRRLFDMRDEHCHRSAARERRIARQGLVEHAGEGVEVGPPSHGLAGDLLGGGVGDRSREMWRLLRVGARIWATCEAEVGEVAVLPTVFLGNEDVGGLHVSVDEPSGVRGVERGRDLTDQRERPLGIERRRRARAVCGGRCLRRSAWRCRDAHRPLPRRTRARRSSDRGSQRAGSRRGSAHGSGGPVPARARSASAREGAPAARRRRGRRRPCRRGRRPLRSRTRPAGRRRGVRRSWH